jgi:hypothetical protein
LIPVVAEDCKMASAPFRRAAPAGAVGLAGPERRPFWLAAFD